MKRGKKIDLTYREVFVSQEQFVFFSAFQSGLQSAFCTCKDFRFYFSCLNGAFCHTGHADDTFFCISFSGVSHRDGTNRTAAHTFAAVLADFRSGDHGDGTKGFIGSVAGEGNFAAIFRFCLQFLRPFFQLKGIIGIGLGVVQLLILVLDI